MAVGELSPPQSLESDERPHRRVRESAGPVRRTLEAFASLRLTVVLFALSIGLVLFGTLAQVDHDVWHVVNHTYFRVWVADVEFQALARLYETLSKQQLDAVGGSFPYPGGKLIGLLLASNLVAAHSIRFTIKAKAAKRAWGLAAITAGVAATAAVIASGMDNAVESQLSPEFCAALWHGLRLAVGVAALGGVYFLMQSRNRIRSAEWFTFLLLVAAVVWVAFYLFTHPSFRLDPAGLRILWQLIKGGFAAGVLLWGCVLLFDKRAGVVLLHGGIGLLMLGEALTDPVSNEASMLIREGDTKNYTYNMRKPELAVVDRSPADVDRVTVIPASLLRDAAATGDAVSTDALPFDVRVVKYFQNSSLAPLRQPDGNPATAGVGMQSSAVEITKSAGTGDKTGTDLPAAYVEFVDRQTGESLGVWMVSVFGDEWATTQPWWHTAENPMLAAPWLRQQYDGLNAQAFECDGKTYRVALRFRRDYREWSIRLNDFEHTTYVGTNTPKNYASQVTLTDASRGVERDFEIKMNNPLRYAGTTLYQQGFDSTTDAATILQVVKSRSWMIPYVACMIVGVGMVYHFSLTLGRFMQRRMRDSPAQQERARLDWRSPQVFVPVGVACLFAVYALGKARVPEDEPGAMPVQRFGALALADGGRVKPYDTYARTVLQALSERREVDQRKVAEADRPACAKELKRVPAIKWMLDSIADVDGARDYRVFRIANLDLLETLGLPARPGFFRYSYNEIGAAEQELRKQLALTRQVASEDDLSPFQRKVLDLNAKLNRYQVMVRAFSSPPISANPETIQAEVQQTRQAIADLSRLEAPRPVPPVQVGGQWDTLLAAELDALFDQVRGMEPNRATLALSAAIRGYQRGDAAMFVGALDSLETQLAKHQEQLHQPANADAVAGMANAEKLDLEKVAFERFFSAFSPFYCAMVLYVAAFVLVALSWLAWPQVLGRSATAVLVVALLLHAFALAGRVYISGRPPVTNLYSSAVFIGAGAALLGLILEAVYRMGVGTVVGSVVGFLTLVIAYHLSLDNDTFTVMQAVLDTQFWLATHVVCVTLGYSTTFLAGFLGIVYLFGVEVTGRLSGDQAKQVIRMIYGTLCFAIVFSFIGTVLGGLWGDDSWGRFWGWDPKENGALIIVLWNALILHARWGAMVGHRGLAALAIAGNIVTSWSWFGVNELGVGLHAYGGLSDTFSFQVKVLHAVLWSHLALIALTLAWPQRRATPAPA